MPWIRARLRDQLVYARADERGELVAQGGRVEVRYKPGDGRAYQAAARNLTVEDATPLPDSTCGDAAAVPPKAAGAPAKGAAAPRRARPASPATGEAEHAHDDSAVADGKTIVAYTDGACTGNPGPAGLGVVVLDKEGRTERSEFLGRGTNNIAELTAIQRALEMTAGPVVIHTDSQYAIGVLNKGWKAKANAELIQEIRALLAQRRGVEFVYVRGHAGVPLNERADELARLAISTGQTRTARV